MGVSVFKRLCRLLIALTMALGSVMTALGADNDAITTTDDWSQEAAIAARRKAPILVVFTSPECGYCERLKSQVLLPLYYKGGNGEPAVILREYSTHTGGKIGDFDGERVRARVFLRRFDVFATPTVVLLDSQGQPLGSPIVGYNSAEAYAPQLQRAIAEAQADLQSQGSGKNLPRYH